MNIEDVVMKLGDGLMTGGSAASLRTQALNQLNQFLHDHSRDSWGALNHILMHWVEQDELLAQNYASPLVALKHTIVHIQARPETLHEFVRQIDVQYAQTHQEKPIFQKPGDEAHPDDEYTHQSVEAALKALLAKL